MHIASNLVFLSVFFFGRSFFWTMFHHCNAKWAKEQWKNSLFFWCFENKDKGEISTFFFSFSSAIEQMMKHTLPEKNHQKKTKRKTGFSAICNTSTKKTENYCFLKKTKIIHHINSIKMHLHTFQTGFPLMCSGTASKSHLMIQSKGTKHVRRQSQIFFFPPTSKGQKK